MVYKSIGFVTKFENVARRLEFGDIPTPAEGSSVAAEMGGYTRADRTRVPPPDPSAPLTSLGTRFPHVCLKAKTRVLGSGLAKEEKRESQLDLRD